MKITNENKHINTKIEKRDRSWIFFFDEDTKNPNIFCRQTEDNIYRLDCETGKLFIWSKKWNALTEVGVSQLIQQSMSLRNNNELVKGTRIFYKGIELQSKCIEKDTALLEYIDIKADLDRKYINISRRGFTEEGERYFEEKLYPGMMQAIQKVLRHLETSVDIESCNNNIIPICEKKDDSQKTSDNFVECICMIVKNKCDCIMQLSENKESEDELETVKNELVSLVVSISVLSYFALRDEWNILEKLEETQPKKIRIWNILLQQIDRILTDPFYAKVRADLADYSNFFSLDVFSEEAGRYTARGERGLKNKINFLQIFLENNHWAILQQRKNAHSSWTAALILLNNGNEEQDIDIDKNEDGSSSSYSNILIKLSQTLVKANTKRQDNFSSITTIPRTNEIQEQLEKWGENLCGSSTVYPEIDTNSGQQFILNWMLKNIPTVGLFCNEEGNIRVNVLASRIYPSIYVNENFKFLIMERMMQMAKAENIRRFSTFAWQGREYLSCNELPFHVFFIKRGYLSGYSYHKCIVPFDGELLTSWHDILIRKNDSEKIRDLEALLFDMSIKNYIKNTARRDKQSKEFLSNTPTSIELGLIEILIDIMIDKLQKTNYKPAISFEDLLDLKNERKEGWNRIYSKLLIIYINNQKNGRHNENEQDIKEKNINNFEKKQFDLDSIKKDPAFITLCASWFYCFIERENTIGKSEVALTYETYMKEHPETEKKEERLISYIQSRLQYQTNTENIRKNIDQYKIELLEIVKKMEKRCIDSYFKDFDEFYQRQIRKLQNSYTQHVNEENKNQK